MGGYGGWATMRGCSGTPFFQKDYHHETVPLLFWHPIVCSNQYIVDVDISTATIHTPVITLADRPRATHSATSHMQRAAGGRQGVDPLALAWGSSGQRGAGPSRGVGKRTGWRGGGWGRRPPPLGAGEWGWETRMAAALTGGGRREVGDGEGERR